MRITSGGNTLIKTAIDNGTDALQVEGSGRFSSSITASSFIRSGGTSSQFLKADGSVDANTYITSAGAVTSIAGTTNQIIASASVGSITLSLPQNIATTSNVTFNTVTATNGGFNSDLSLKTVLLRAKNDKNIANYVEMIKYTWRDTSKGIGERYGYGAQDLLPLIPEAVYKTDNGTYAVDYTQVHTILIDENTRRIQELEREVSELKSQLNSK
jgi:hypothetical protein